MKESMWGYYLVLLGITVSTIMILVSNMTTTNQQDYYLLKEVTNAAMIDSIDYGYYRVYGTVKINTEKFVENFIRRFSEGISKTNTYKIDFYSIYENPPSVSIKVTSNTGSFHISGDETNIDVVNTIDAILEANNVVTDSIILYSMPYANCDESKLISNNTSDVDYSYCELANRAELNLDYYETDKGDSIFSEIQKKLDGKTLDINKIKVQSVEFLSIMDSSSDLVQFESQFSKTYKRESSIYDIPASDRKDYRYLAKNVKDVKITVKKDNDRYYLAYGLKFNCDGAMVYDVPDKPWNNTCLIGIKYKVNFYYDES